MMSTHLRQIRELVDEYDSKLLANDPRFRGLVVVHGVNDMTSMVFVNAFVLKKDPWFCVFTEHYGTHVFHEDDQFVTAYSGREGVDSAPF